MTSQSLKTTIDSSDSIQYAVYLQGLTEETVRKISSDIGEPA